MALSQSNSVAHGLFTQAIWDAYWANSARQMSRAIDQAAQFTGRKPTVVHLFTQWGRMGFPRALLDAIVSRGCQPLWTWEAFGGWTRPDSDYHPASIAKPESPHDAYIRQVAQECKAWGKTVWVRIFHEANARNNTQYPWQSGSTATDVRDAFKKVVWLCRDEQGASNMKWVFNAAIDGSGGRSISAVWPGDWWVDYTGCTVYGNPDWNGGWKSFYDLYLPYYNALNQLSSRPHIIGEFGQVEGSDRQKGQWIKQALTTDLRRLPRIKAMLYFSAQQWPLTSSTGATQGYKDGIANMRGQFK